MGVPASQAWAVIKQVLRQKLRGWQRYPLVLMLEPLLRCNLSCDGCGKIRHPVEVLRRELTPQQCLDAADQCGAPIVSIPGGEPLLHPRISEIVAGLVARRRFVYLCTNALKLEERLSDFQPSRYLILSIHLDGPREEHDKSVGRAGTFDTAVRAARTAISRGFRVATNTTLYAGADVERMRAFFDEMMAMRVEGMMISPGYRYERAPGQQYFLQREQTVQLFRELLAKRKRAWRFNQTPLFLEFLQGNVELECMPWGTPTYNVFGWQRPCYLLEEGYCATFRELIDTTDWNRYGPSSGNAACSDCMVHCGFEPSAVAATFSLKRPKRPSRSR